MKSHDMSDSDESDGEYIPLHRRLAALDGSAGGSVTDPISLESSDEDGGSTAQWSSPPREEVTASAASAAASRTAAGHTYSASFPAPPLPAPSPPPSPPPLAHSPSQSPSPPPPPLGRDSGNIAPPALNATEAKLQRQREREAAKRQKELDKRLRQAETAAKRSVRPEHCQKTLHALVDRRVLEVAGGGQLLAALQAASDVTVHVITAPQPGTVTWRREVTDWTEQDGQIVNTTRQEDEQQLVAVFDAGTLASLIAEQMAAPSHGLTAAMLDLGNASGMTVTVLCWGLDNLCRTKTLAGSYRQAAGAADNGAKRRKRAPPKLDRLQLESVIVDTLLDTPHNLKLVNTPADGGQFLAQMSKAIAEAPFKRQRGHQQFAWFADADGARPVKVDRQLRGLRRLWTEQLRQLSAGSLEAAQAVSDAYPSPQTLLQAYAACGSVGECERLVADLAVRRTVGPLVSSRRVGGEISRKLYLVMTTTDGSAEL